MAKHPLFRVISAAAFLSFAFITPNSYGDSYARIVRLSEVDGSVQIDRNTGKGFENAIPNMPVTQGVRLETGDNGRAEVEFENGSVLRLADHTSIEFTQLSLASSGDRMSDVRVNDGLVYVHYKRKGDDEFRFTFANQAVNLTKDVHFRLNLDRSTAELAVFKGEVNIQGQGESARVKKNETFTLDLNDGARYELAKNISPYSADEWDREREQYLDQYASAQNRVNSPYSYGYSDLNRYGNFFDVPGYGLLWRPTSFGANWDPYSDGYWSYYPGSGYVWISSYPWGWTPYRYGNWQYVPSYGWCWRPGNWNRWNTGIAVHNPPPTWHHPVPPTRPDGSGTTTVVVGQPPRRSPRTIDMENLHAGHPAPSTGLRTEGPGRRDPRNLNTVVVPPTTPATAPNQGVTTTVAPVAPNRPDRRVEIDRKTGESRDERMDQQAIRGHREVQVQTQPAQQQVQTAPAKTMTPLPSPPPTVSVQPQRPTHMETPRPMPTPQPRMESPRPAPMPSPRMESPRMETPRASPPPSKSEGRPNNPK
jgi:hypothetical protein